MFFHAADPRTTTLELLLALPICLWILFFRGGKWIEHSRLGSLLWGIKAIHYQGGAFLILLWTIIWFGLQYQLLPRS